jgi:hypothetical protein
VTYRAVYDRLRHEGEYLLSNIGSQGCLNCGNELISWNGPRDYIEFRLENS